MNRPINLFEYESLAAKHLSKMALDYYSSGAWDEITLRDNRAAYHRYKLLPRVLADVTHRDLSTTILERPINMPVLVAPMAFQRLAHPEGELAVARAAKSMGTTMVLSTMSTIALEEVARETDLLWFQLYVHRDRSLTRALVERAEAAGYSALCLTVDAPVLGQRERDRRNEFSLPQGMELANLTSMAESLGQASLATAMLPSPSARDWKIPKSKGESGLLAYFARQLDPGLTWQDVEWLQSLTKLPVVVKGILRGDDARRAVECGVKGIVVSNHGGRQLDGAIATIDALAEVVAAVGDKAEVLVDGGIRRGTDILKAIALGAKAVLVGRPILWGLAAGGEAGARHVLELLREELDLAMALSGCAKIDDIDVSLVRHCPDSL